MSIRKCLVRLHAHMLARVSAWVSGVVGDALVQGVCTDCFGVYFKAA